MDVNFFPQNMLQDIWNLSEQKIPVSVTRDVISGVYYARKKSADAYHQGYLTGCEKGLADGRNSTEECALPPEMMNLPIQYLNLSVRPYNCLYRSGYEYIRDIVSLSKEEIFKIRNLGRFGANEIAKALCDRGILDSEWNHYLFCDD